MAKNPTWYDLLGVARDASPAEIKAAWRAATDTFEPGSGTSQFALFNEAADTLLDPAKRAAYDEGLDAPSSPSTTASEEPPPPPPVDLSKDDAAISVHEPRPGLLDRLRAARPHGGIRMPVVSWPVVSVLALLAVGSLVAAVLLGMKAMDRAEAAEAGDEAVAVAERALTAVLSYDYRQMEEDRDRAVTFLTPDYRKDYAKTFALLTDGPEGSEGGVVKTKTVVTADVLDAAVVKAETDRVRVIAFVNQSSVKAGGDPAIFQNRVVATLVKDGDTWLIDDITSY